MLIAGIMVQMRCRKFMIMMVSMPAVMIGYISDGRVSMRQRVLRWNQRTPHRKADAKQDYPKFAHVVG